MEDIIVFSSFGDSLVSNGIFVGFLRLFERLTFPYRRRPCGYFWIKMIPSGMSVFYCIFLKRKIYFAGTIICKPETTFNLFGGGVGSSRVANSAISSHYFEASHAPLTKSKSQPSFDFHSLASSFSCSSSVTDFTLNNPGEICTLFKYFFWILGSLFCP